jgi:DNA-binding PadR family transcriptional regulator
MLRPAILTILRDQACELHGYAIEKELRVFRFFERQPPDFAGLYRLLKRMEGEGLLASARGDSQAGPSRRVYRLTGRGRKCLSRWLDSLVEYREMLEDLIAHMQDTAGGGV